jgi:hypothetical protein
MRRSLDQGRPHLHRVLLSMVSVSHTANIPLGRFLSSFFPSTASSSSLPPRSCPTGPAGAESGSAWRSARARSPRYVGERDGVLTRCRERDPARHGPSAASGAAGGGSAPRSHAARSGVSPCIWQAHPPTLLLEPVPPVPRLLEPPVPLLLLPEPVLLLLLPAVDRVEVASRWSRVSLNGCVGSCSRRAPPCLGPRFPERSRRELFASRASLNGPALP